MIKTYKWKLNPLWHLRRQNGNYFSIGINKCAYQQFLRNLEDWHTHLGKNIPFLPAQYVSEWAVCYGRRSQTGRLHALAVADVPPGLAGCCMQFWHRTIYQHLDNVLCRWIRRRLWHSGNFGTFMWSNFMKWGSICASAHTDHMCVCASGWCTHLCTSTICICNCSNVGGQCAHRPFEQAHTDHLNKFTGLVWANAHNNHLQKYARGWCVKEYTVLICAHQPSLIK